MKKNMATAMAAAMAFGAVVPAFANEISPMAVVDEVDTALAEGREVALVAYDGAYDTNFTEDKKDDKLKEGVIILDKISDDRYLISTPIAQADLTEAKKNEIKQAKKNLDDTVSEIKHLLTLKYDSNGVKKNKYRLSQTEVFVDESVTPAVNNTSIVVTLDALDGSDDHTFTFKNVVLKREDSSTATKAPVNLTEESTATELKGYDLLSKYVFELEKNASKITVVKAEKNKTTLELKVYKKDSKKTHVATIEIAGFDKFDSDEFTHIPGKNIDFANHWAEDAIFNAMLTGKVDTASKFRPEDGITRAEFIKIVNKSFGLKTKAGSEKFSDVNEKHWFYNDVLVALEAGYIDGYNDGTFRPDAKITKQEAAKIVASVMDSKKALDTYVDEDATPLKDGKVEVVIKDANGKPVHLDSETKFKDDKKIETWADESVIALSHKDVNVVTGYKGYFNPSNSITRAEALTMMEKGAAFVK